MRIISVGRTLRKASQYRYAKNHNNSLMQVPHLDFPSTLLSFYICNLWGKIGWNLLAPTAHYMLPPLTAGNVPVEKNLYKYE